MSATIARHRGVDAFEDHSRPENADQPASEAGLDVTTLQIETHILCGGDPQTVIAALARAKAKGLHCTWSGATAADLAGIDPIAAVQAGVDPARVVGSAEFAGRFRRQEQTPAPGR